MCAGRELTIRNPTALLLIPSDVRDRILSQEHINTFNDAGELVIIQIICWQAASLIQPCIYPHVNLLNLDAFTSFSGAVAEGRLDLGQWVRTLQICSNTEGLSERLLIKNIPTMTLHSFSTSKISRLLSPLVKRTTYEKPIFEECWRHKFRHVFLQ